MNYISGLNNVLQINSFSLPIEWFQFLVILLIYFWFVMVEYFRRVILNKKRGLLDYVVFGFSKLFAIAIIFLTNLPISILTLVLSLFYVWYFILVNKQKVIETDNDPIYKLVHPTENISIKLDKTSKNTGFIHLNR